MVKFSIVEDDDVEASRLKGFIDRYAKATSLTTEIVRFTSAVDMLKKYDRSVDVIFLDIELPGMNGMDAAKKIRQIDSKVTIIFVTNLAQYAVGGYEVNAFDFIVKPVMYPSFAMKLRRVLKYLHMRRDREIWVTTRQGKKQINAAALKYVEVMKHVVIYHLEHETVTASGTLKSVVETLEGLPFALCNRCYLVNFKYVTEINGNTVVVGGDELQIAAPRRHEFLNAFNEYLGAGGGGNVLTTLALYKFLFTTELLVAEALFTRRFARRKHFVWRAIGGIAACYTLTALFPLFDNTYNGWYVSFMFLTLFASTFGAVMLCYAVPLKNAFFCCLTAYTAQHLSYELFKLSMTPFSFFDAKNLYGNDMLDLTKISGETLIAALLYFDANLAVYTAAYFIIGKKIGRDGDLHIRNGYMLLLSAVILLVDILLNAFTVYIEAGYNKLYDVIIGLYNSLCCVLVFYIQSSTISANDMRVELNAVSELLFQAQRQYEMKKEEIDLINIKCHDLKHRISSMGGLDEPTAREIKDMISIYDANVNTGNKVVDIILTEKSLICHGKNIQLTCMADCSRLGFIADGDLYALFGNIVDNAIEATSRVDDCEKRAISLNIHTECGFVTVMCENYYDGVLKLDGNGMPMTTKRDTDYHGFGIKSVKAIAEKYGGRAGIVSDDDIFRINVMIPLQQHKPVE